MGTKYDSNSISGYNSSPPADDGSTTEANKVKWATIKTKITDPVKTLTETINSELTTHFDTGPTGVAAEVTLGAGHYNQVIEASGASDITLTDASSLTAGWFCDIINKGSSNFNLVRATASDTIDSVSSDVVIYPLDSIRVVVNASADGFLTHGFLGNMQKWRKGADIASTAALAPGNDGNYFDVSAPGTTDITSINTKGIGTVIKLHFDGISVLTHDASDLVLPGGTNITTAAGDEFEFIEYAIGDWRATHVPSALSDTAYAASWDGVTAAAPSKNAVYDQLELMGSQPVTFKIKASDEDVTSSTTLQDDDDLTTTIAANGVYIFEASVVVGSTSSTPDYKWQWVTPDGDFVFTNFACNENSAAEAVVGESSGAGSQNSGITLNVLRYFTSHGLIRAGGAGGTFKLQWAQNISDGTATTVKAGSYMKLTKIA